MTFRTLACFLLIASAAVVEAHPLGGVVTFPTRLRGSDAVSGLETNVCNTFWNYCPRDPGCKTYTMSTHNVMVYAHGYTESVKAEELKDTDVLTVVVTGETTRTSVPVSGSYKIYALSGGNLAAGSLDSVLTIDAPNFQLTIPVPLSDKAFDRDNKWFEFGIDIFQEASGSDEGMCIEISDTEYLDYEKAKLTPPFETYCVDEGNGHFKAEDHTITGNPIVPAVPCGAPPTPSCGLYSYLCPRDPGCETQYDVSVTHTELVVDGSKLEAGDKVNLRINCTTQLHTVPVDGSYKIYSLSGKNLAAGSLADVFEIQRCVNEGCYCFIDVHFTLLADAFSPSEGWFEFGFDMFQKASGSDEGFCLEVANKPYLDYEKTHSEPPGFVTLCKDEGWGHYKTATTPEVVRDVECVLRPSA